MLHEKFTSLGEVPCRYLISCEHASNRVPSRYRRHFEAKQRLLSTHRAWDKGASELAGVAAQALGNAPLFLGRWSRLVVDLNRSSHSEELLSEMMHSLSSREGQKILASIYHPYRESIVRTVRGFERPVVHLSVHSFAPVLRGNVRDCDVGILFDPKRGWERQVAKRLKYQFAREWPRARVRFNYPYRGTDDGLTTWMRGIFAEEQYAGIELEFNQRLVRSPRLLSALCQRLSGVCQRMIVRSLRPRG